MGRTIIFSPLTSLYYAIVITNVIIAVPAANSNPEVCYGCDDVYADYSDADVRLVGMLGLQLNYDHVCTAHSFGVWKAALGMKWAVSMLNGEHDDTTNSSNPFIPGIKIGLDIINDCSIPSKAAYHTGLLVSAHDGRVLDDAILCRDRNETSKAAPLVGMLGTSVSSSTTMVADVLRNHPIPLVGVSATVHELSNKTLYPMFLRSVPSDMQQAQTIVELAKQLKWFFLMGIHSDTMYGRVGMLEIQDHAKKERICVIKKPFEIGEDFLAKEDNIKDLVRGTLFLKLDITKGVLGVVFFGEYQYFMKILQYIKDENLDPNYITRIQWILSDAVPLTDDLKNLLEDLNMKAYLIGPPKIPLLSFTDHLAEVLSTPPHWLTDQWRSSIRQALAYSYNCRDFQFTTEDVARCQLRNKIEHTTYTAAAIDSVYIMASLLRKAHHTLCGTSSGVCDRLQEVIKKGLLSEVSFHNTEIAYESLGKAYAPAEFVDDQRRLVNTSSDLKVSGQPLYSVTQHFPRGSFPKIAHADVSGDLIFSEHHNTTEPSECNEQCEECYSLNDVPYVFKSGDVILVGVFSLHTVSETNPLECGEFRDTSLDFVAMEAFVNIIQRQSSETGKTFGYLILDDCYSPVRATKLLLDILGGDVPVVEKGTGRVLDPDKVYAVIGANTSPNTMAILSQLKVWHRPLVSYAASIPSFNNRILFPYFLRTVPSDTMQAQALVKMLNMINVSYVGVLALDNIYGMELDRLFRELAAQEKICVEPVFPMTVYTKEEEIERRLGVLKAKGVKVIVLIVSSSIVPKVLESKPVKEHNFHFIATETWDLNDQIIGQGRGESAKGSFIFQPSQWVTLNDRFRDHLEHLNPFEEDSPVWLKKFWEGYFECDMPGSFLNKHKRLCQPTTHWGNESYDLFFNFTKTLRTSVATFSVVSAIKKIMRTDLFQKGPGRELAENLTRTIRETKIGGTLVFDQEGNGNSALDIYNLQEDENGNYNYVPVGQYVNTGELKLDLDKAKFYDGLYGKVSSSVDSTCKNKPDCTICLSMVNPSTESPVLNIPLEEDSKDDGGLVALAVVLAVVLMLMVGIVVVYVLVRMGRVRLFGIAKAGENYASVSSNGVRPSLPPRPDNRSEEDPRGSPNGQRPMNYYTMPSGGSNNSTGPSSGESVGHGNSKSDENQNDLGGSVSVSRVDGVFTSGHRDISLSDTAVNRSVNSIASDDVTDRDVDKLLAQSVVNAGSSEISISPAPSHYDMGREISSQTMPFIVSLDRESPLSLSSSDLSSRRTAMADLGVTYNYSDTYGVTRGGGRRDHILPLPLNNRNLPPPRPHKYKTSKSTSEYLETVDQETPTYSTHTSNVPSRQFQRMQQFAHSSAAPVGIDRAQSYPNGVPNQPLTRSVHDEGAFHRSPSDGVILSVDSRAVYIPDNNHHSNLLHRGYSNPAYLHSPEDDLGRQFPQQRVLGPVMTPATSATPSSSSIHPGMHQQHVYITPNNGLYFSKDETRRIPFTPNVHQSPPTTTNVAYVMSNPPPTRANPRPHHKHTNSNSSDYLDATDPPFLPQTKTTNSNVTTPKTNTTPRESNKDLNNVNTSIPKLQNPHNYQNPNQVHSEEKATPLPPTSAQQFQTRPTEPKSKRPAPQPNTRSPTEETPNPITSPLHITPEHSGDDYDSEKPNGHANDDLNQDSTQSIPFSLVSNATTLSEEDNNDSRNNVFYNTKSHEEDDDYNPQLSHSAEAIVSSTASSPASQPVSFGFQPHSTMSTSSDYTLASHVPNPGTPPEPEVNETETETASLTDSDNDDTRL